MCRFRLADKREGWLVTRYDDVVFVLKDDCFVKEGTKVMTPEQAARQPWVPKAFKPLAQNMVDVDPPDHTRLRCLVHRAFTPRFVETMRARIQRLTDQLLDAVEARGRFELIRDYALPLPVTIIAEMLGVPVGDHSKFHRWSSAVIESSSSTWGKLKSLPHIMAFMSYIRKLVKVRQADPRDDLISALGAGARGRRRAERGRNAGHDLPAPRGRT